MALSRCLSPLPPLPQMEVPRAAQTYPGQPGVPHHLPGHDPGHHHPPHGGQSRGDRHRTPHDPHLSPRVPGAGQMEDQAQVAGEDHHRHQQLADEAPGGDPAEMRGLYNKLTHENSSSAQYLLVL